MEQLLIIIGASIFGILGFAHLVFTFFTDKFNAYDENVTKSMKETSLVITKDTTVWDAWVGFNASHSLGAILIAAIYVPLALFNMSVIEDNIYYSLLIFGVSLVYLGLAAKYWFKVPFVGIAIAATCFLGVVLAKIT